MHTSCNPFIDVIKMPSICSSDTCHAIRVIKFCVSAYVILQTNSDKRTFRELRIRPADAELSISEFGIRDMTSFNHLRNTSKDVNHMQFRRIF